LCFLPAVMSLAKIGAAKVISRMVESWGAPCVASWARAVVEQVVGIAMGNGCRCTCLEVPRPAPDHRRWTDRAPTASPGGGSQQDHHGLAFGLVGRDITSEAQSTGRVQP
jgi:hypothetical protein